MSILKSEANLGLLQHEHFVTIVNDWKPLTIITKSIILDVVAALNPPLKRMFATSI